MKFEIELKVVKLAKSSFFGGRCLKLISQTKALQKLETLRAEFRGYIRANFEHKAADCISCNDFGKCCKDKNFVNVRLTKLEAKAIAGEITKLNPLQRDKVISRIKLAASKFRLFSDEDDFFQSFSCPLFEENIGCLVHNGPKPFACIHHGCYEKAEDLPPDEILDDSEKIIARIERFTYGKSSASLPLPVALVKWGELFSVGRRPE